MAKVLVCYYSRSGHTKKMAEEIAAVIGQEGLSVDLKDVKELEAKELLNYQGIVIGSPTYYGTMAWPVKKLLDESVRFHGKLKGRVGGAFASSANIGGGNETTILDILNALLIHGMVIQGDSAGDHYGPVSIGKPDERSLKCCRSHARNLSKLVQRLFA